MKETLDHEKTILPPSTMLNPTPVVMVSCAGLHPEQPEERPNILTIGWTGTINSEPPMVSISVRPERHSHGLIKDTKEFVINLVTEELLKACDYCGVRSGAQEDKFAAMSLTAVPAEGLKYAPAIQEAAISISCRVASITKLGTHDMFVAKVVGVTADKRLLDKAGKLCLEDAGLVCYSHGEYYSLGRFLGFFGYSVASPEAFRRRTRGKKEMTAAAKPVQESTGRTGRDMRSSGTGARRPDYTKPGQNRPSYAKKNSEPAYEKRSGDSAPAKKTYRGTAPARKSYGDSAPVKKNYGGSAAAGKNAGRPDQGKRNRPGTGR